MGQLQSYFEQYQAGLEKLPTTELNKLLIAEAHCINCEFGLVADRGSFRACLGLVINSMVSSNRKRIVCCSFLAVCEHGLFTTGVSITYPSSGNLVLRY